MLCRQTTCVWNADRCFLSHWQFFWSANVLSFYLIQYQWKWSVQVQQDIINLSSVSIALFFTALIYVNIFNEGRGEGKLIISQPKNIFLHFFSILVPGSGHITLFAGWTTDILSVHNVYFTWAIELQYILWVVIWRHDY